MGVHPQPELRNHTLIVTVSSDDGRPVLDRRAYESLARTFHEAADNDEVRVVVLRGLAGCFCLGGDFSEFLDATKHQKLIAAVTDMFRTLATFPKPILACVDGDAVGVGCTILFHCDMVIASNESTFRVPFVDFGLVPDAATSILAPQKLGYAGAFRFFCLGDTLRAEDARALGLVAEIVRMTVSRRRRLAGPGSSPRSRSPPCCRRAACSRATPARCATASTRRYRCSSRRCRTTPRCGACSVLPGWRPERSGKNLAPRCPNGRAARKLNLPCRGMTALRR